ncbi:unnamed protein product [Lactuca virosa]|uniref:Coatomer beta subunit C-terminal domain-containing protein n=1 Tax=Lactuca virosa TaxID=75947 RepID=A0AAU9M7Z9_9ASTR|nr:unnamed protein product [Lactuca virosa]
MSPTKGLVGGAPRLCSSPITWFHQKKNLIYRRNMQPRTNEMSQLELEDEVGDDLKRSSGEFIKEGDATNKLNWILQLTGFSDPAYAEAYVTVNRYDIVLIVTIINRTKETLQSICLELATMGDLKLDTLAPKSRKQIKENIKASSTEIGVIFGNFVHETSNLLKCTAIVLNDIHIDIMDYISLAGVIFRYRVCSCSLHKLASHLIQREGRGCDKFKKMVDIGMNFAIFFSFEVV